MVLDSDLAAVYGVPTSASMNSFDAIGSVFLRTSPFDSPPKNSQF